MNKLLSLVLFSFLIIFGCDQSKLSSDISQKNEHITSRCITKRNFFKKKIYNYFDGSSDLFDRAVCVPANFECVVPTGFFSKTEYGYRYCKFAFYKIESGKSFPDNKSYITHKSYFCCFNNYDDPYKIRYYVHTFIKNEEDKNLFVSFLKTYLPQYKDLGHDKYNYVFELDIPSNSTDSVLVFRSLKSPSEEKKFKSYVEDHEIDLIEIGEK